MRPIHLTQQVGLVPARTLQAPLHPQLHSASAPVKLTSDAAVTHSCQRNMWDMDRPLVWPRPSLHQAAASPGMPGPDVGHACAQVSLHAVAAGAAVLSLYVRLRGLQQRLLTRSAPGPDAGRLRAQVNLHAMTAGVAMLSLYVWLMGLKQCLLTRSAGCLPTRLAIVSDKGKSSKEAGNLVVKEAVTAMMVHWEAPFRRAPCAVDHAQPSSAGRGSLPRMQGAGLAAGAGAPLVNPIWAHAHAPRVPCCWVDPRPWNPWPAGPARTTRSRACWRRTGRLWRSG